jgi:hypothetical protein
MRESLKGMLPATQTVSSLASAALVAISPA